MIPGLICFIWDARRTVQTCSKNSSNYTSRSQGWASCRVHPHHPGEIHLLRRVSVQAGMGLSQKRWRLEVHGAPQAPRRITRSCWATMYPHRTPGGGGGLGPRRLICGWGPSLLPGLVPAARILSRLADDYDLIHDVR